MHMTGVTVMKFILHLLVEKTEQKDSKMKIVFFSPHEGIWVHAFPEALVAESLKKYGHEISYIFCDEVFQKYCVTMSAYGLEFGSPEEKRKEICITCGKNQNLLAGSVSLPSFYISNYLREADYRDAEDMSQSKSVRALFEYQEDGISIGKPAAYEILLKFKKNSLEFNNFQEAAYRTSFYNALLSKRAADRWMNDHKPDAVVIYNTNYAVNRVTFFAGSARNIPVYSIHAGDIISDRLSRLMIAQDNLLKNCYDIKDSFQKEDREQFCHIDAVKDYLSHLRELFLGKHFLVYSSGVDRSKKDIRSFLGLKQGQKLVVATMSSYDEMFAAEATGLVHFPESGIYKNQLEWLQDTISWIKDKKDYFLLIRVHPREFPNKRDQYNSDHGMKVKELLSSLPDNCRLNLPDDGISLYALALETDLVLNAWSSAGEEMAVFGIPVVLYNKELTLYPAEINVIASDREDYFVKIQEFCVKKIQRKDIKNILSWIIFRLSFTTFSLKESYSERSIEERGLTFIERIRLKWKSWKIDKRLLPLEERVLALRANSLKAGKYLDMLFRRKSDNLYSVAEYRKSFPREDSEKMLNFFIDEFITLQTEAFGKEDYEKSKLKARWDFIKNSGKNDV